MDATIIQAGLVAAQDIINKALKFDPACQQKLAALAPKVLAIEINQPQVTIYVNFAQSIVLQSHYEGRADARLSGGITAFMNLATNADKQAALMKSDIQIHGSSQLALALADVMSQLNIDWEAMISELTGPVIAHVMGKQLRSIGGWFKQATQKVKDDSVEYVRDELQLAPHKLEGESRFSDIHKLKLDTERLEARFNRLKQSFK